ncbi:MAG TPA: DUF3108 domain-containing protein [Gemmatimonadaceae bacterium]|nr:DUF3108 domain-containing protein [Gemmatimonadaceae bacterium]
MRTLLLLTGIAAIVGTSAASSPNASPESTPPRPFHVGETFTYDAKVNFLHAGSATMKVLDVEPIRGHPTYHTSFDVDGHVLFFHVRDHSESWFDTTKIVSLHQVQHIDETDYHADRVYDFYPDRQIYVRNDTTGHSVSDPLDEDAFLYFIRTIPLEVGKTYRFDRYYHLEKNPVVITVERREHIKVPAGEFDAIVIQPTIKSAGLFSEKRKTELWLADDSTRAILRLKSKLPIGTFYLELKKAEFANRS